MKHLKLLVWHVKHAQTQWFLSRQSCSSSSVMIAINSISVLLVNSKIWHVCHSLKYGQEISIAGIWYLLICFKCLKLVSPQLSFFLQYLFYLKMQAHSQGGLVGSDKPPSQTKGPLFYAKRSTFCNKRSTFYNTGPLFFNKRSPFSPACKQKVHYKENKMPLSSTRILYKRPNIHTKYLFLFIGLSLPFIACHVLLLLPITVQRPTNV